MFNAIDRFGSPPDFVAIAWLQEDGAAWERELGLTPLGAARSEQPEPAVLSAALQSLSNMVNKSTGIAHPSDEAAFHELLHLLHAGGEALDPEFACRKLIALGWRMEHAQEVAGKMRRFMEGHRPRRRAPSPWREDILDRWRSEPGSDAR
jgi:hypothetical protein